jgi:hypothetical protein
MEGIDPVMKMGQTRFYKNIRKDGIYVVALDPSMGTGGDYAAIQVYELPSFKQVAEWQHNQTAIPEQVRTVREINTYIADVCGSDNVYWSVENNSIGEAVLLIINDIGEENIPGLLLSEPMRKGHIRKFRKGFNTTHKTKISSCSRLKTLIENDKLHIYSKPLISELKGFVAQSTSFKAKSGQHDDLVSATLLVMRMMQVLAEWDPRIYQQWGGAVGKTGMTGDDDYEAPMPIFISNSF